jgi:hypothetical protein
LATEVVVAYSLNKHFRSNLYHADAALINSSGNYLADGKGVKRECGERHWERERSSGSRRLDHKSELLDSLVKSNFKESNLSFELYHSLVRSKVVGVSRVHHVLKSVGEYFEGFFRGCLVKLSHKLESSLFENSKHLHFVVHVHFHIYLIKYKLYTLTSKKK